jgi:hypothetical protein
MPSREAQVTPDSALPRVVLSVLIPNIRL